MSFSGVFPMFLAMAVALVAAGLAYVLITSAGRPAPVVGSFSFEATISGN